MDTEADRIGACRFGVHHEVNRTGQVAVEPLFVGHEQGIDDQGGIAAIVAMIGRIFLPVVSSLPGVEPLHPYRSRPGFRQGGQTVLTALEAGHLAADFFPIPAE